MDNSLMVSNVYAAYTAGADKSGQNVSELSKMARGGSEMKKETVFEDTSLNMDKVIISKEALEKLGGLSMNSVREK